MRDGTDGRGMTALRVEKSLVEEGTTSNEFLLVELT